MWEFLYFLRTFSTVRIPHVILTGINFTSASRVSQIAFLLLACAPSNAYNNQKCTLGVSSKVFFIFSG